MIRHGQGMNKEAVCEMKLKILLIFLVLVIIGLIGMGLWWKGVFRPSPTVEHDRKIEPLRPELILTVNGSGRIKITPGTPLVFRLLLRNGLAARAAGVGESLERMKKELDEMVQNQEMTKEEAEEMMKREKVPTEVPVIVVTVSADGVTFQQETRQGSAKLQWQIKAVEPIAPVIVTLDAKQTASATFVASPETTLSIRKDTYRIRSEFENRVRGQWKGKVTSNEIVITVVETPRDTTVEDKKEEQKSMGGYYRAIKDYERAIGAAKQILMLDPQSIEGLLLLGEAQEDKGDYKAALEAYEESLHRFFKRYPGAGHPPERLMENIWRMRDKLGIELPVIEEPIQQ